MGKNRKIVLKEDASNYARIFEQFKSDIQQSRVRAVVSITMELTMLYLRIGKVLSEKTKSGAWGSKTIERLARDLKNHFHGVNGFSVRNLQYMRKFADSCVDDNYAAAAAQIPWGHNMLLLDRFPSSPEKRTWYIQQAVIGGWSRRELEDWVDSNLYGRSGKAVTNFSKTLMSLQSEMAEETMKDPYNLDFLTLSAAHKEKELEQGLMDHLQKFLVELGDGFAFMGRQFRLDIEGEDHFLDLLFYHVKLRCYIVIELKATAFDPRDVGQMNFYLSAVDDSLRQPHDQPSIGLLLCKKKNKVKAEYALRDLKKPIGVASYETKLSKNLPKQLISKLPTVEEIEDELSTIEVSVVNKPIKKAIQKTSVKKKTRK